MAVEACPTPNLRDDLDEDEVPLIFKRNNPASKQNQSNSEAKKVSSLKRDGQSSRQISDARPANGGSSNAQTCRVAPPSRPSQTKSPMCSAKGSTPSVKQSLVSSAANPGSSTSGTDKVNQQKLVTAVKPEKFSAAELKDDSEDSEDDKPLKLRLSASSTKGNSNQVRKQGDISRSVHGPCKPEVEESDDEKPLASRFPLKSGAGESICKHDDSDDNVPIGRKIQQNGYAVRDGQTSKSLNLSNKRPPGDVKSLQQSLVKKPKLSSASPPSNRKQASVKAEPKAEDEDNLPISQRIKKSPTSVIKPPSSSIKKTNKVVSSSVKSVNKKSRKIMKTSKYSKSSKVPPGSGEGQKWTKLVHNGVIFPPPYKPHGVKMRYQGQPVDLTPEQEEVTHMLSFSLVCIHIGSLWFILIRHYLWQVATMFAVMLDTDYMNKSRFRENFFSDWKKMLGKSHVIQNLDDCDFTPIYEWHQREKEKKKQLSTEVSYWGFSLEIVLFGVYHLYGIGMRSPV